MNKPSNFAKADAYFDNSERDKNEDFTEVLNMKEELEALKKDMGENMTETQVDFQKKINQLIRFRNNMLLSYFESINEKGYIELNVRIIKLFRKKEKYYELL